ncbi:indole-3-glycerol phosphate synthase TrpC [Flavobacterium microcysteis]|uniref:Indole-3-glycerol phosphate synthase n=1 Tax=Flavobacterium microcysteis TaxID=2596891 RepID=A0A501Q2Z1_9FLAO|nr:indole-3-glycerol phosphate synthase TrpC [Flavobacterium microcysteis]TPD67249.1 indole-3-glycerol phosphate synthase TrpC [Flavobacterium microcysteis]
MTILDKIIADKKREIQLKKSIISTKQLERSDLFERPVISISKSIRNSAGIIAEHKRRSPSKKVINDIFSVEEVTRNYEIGGAAAVSILTDAKYFGGSIEDLQFARASVSLPVLRKEFIVDPYQILEAKSHGADAILLIAAILTREEISELSNFAQSLSLEVLLEIHNQEELDKSLMSSLDLIGVNNRNLKTFEVDLANSLGLSEAIPDDFVKISESGIQAPKDVHELRKYGFEGFLIGENFMKTDNPGLSLKNFIAALHPDTL